MSTSDERLTKLEVSVGVLDTKMDATGKKLDDVALLLQNQTTILGKFLAYEERANNFEADFSVLKADYSATKLDVLKTLTTYRAIVLSGVVFVSTIIGLGLYIYNDKIDMLDRHEQILSSHNNNK